MSPRPEVINRSSFSLPLNGAYKDDDVSLALVLREYDWYPLRVERWGRVVKVVLPHGKYGLKRSASSFQRLVEIGTTLDQLADRGGLPLLPFVPNKYGDLVIQGGEQAYYALPWVEQAGAAPYRTDWEMKVMEELGRLHARICRFVPLEGILLRSLLQVKMRWRKQLVQMEQWKRAVEGKTILSREESVLLQFYPRLSAYAQKSLFLMDKWLHAHLGAGRVPLVLCHGRLERSHVLWKNGQIYFLNFDRAFWAHPAIDLAFFFRRHLDPSPHFRPETGWRWLRGYLHFFPLTPSQLMLLYLFLINPEPVFFVVNHGPVKEETPFHWPLWEEELGRFENLIQLVDFFLDRTTVRANRSRKTG